MEALEREPLQTAGLSGAEHERVVARLYSGETLPLVVKRVRPSRSWTAYRTGDRTGREALLLAEPRLHGVWDVFRSPYRAFAIEEDAIGLLMDDLSPFLLPAHGGPMTFAQEDTLLGSLAALHARYWERDDALELPWLCTVRAKLGILHPITAPAERERAGGAPLFEAVCRGWDLALARLPPAASSLLLRPPEVLAVELDRLPRTLLHGDPKWANAAFLPDGEVAAFDWATMGAGPASLDLGYYLAVNGPRLARSREDVAARYRSLLEQRLGRVLPGSIWERLVRTSILVGGVLLLWQKALALDAGAPGAEEDWRWWAERLGRLTRKG